MHPTEGIIETFEAVDARGFLYAKEIERGGMVEGLCRAQTEIDIDGAEPVAAASVIKIVFAVAFARAIADGRLDPREQIEVPAELRNGGSGTSGFVDPALVSLRDLALLMVTVSDNAATDLVCARLGAEAIQAVIDELELSDTHVRSDMRSAAMRVAAELGLSDTRDLDAQLATVDPDRIRSLGWLDPARANATTARDTARLLDAIWTDRAGPPESCALVRQMLQRAENTQRLASGFRGDVEVAGKTGTLPFVRNEAGVVTYPDGPRFAVAIFTRTNSPFSRNAEVDAAIGQAARLAVEALRGG